VIITEYVPEATLLTQLVAPPGGLDQANVYGEVPPLTLTQIEPSVPEQVVGEVGTGVTVN
jgi:hypothetical protein